MTFRKQSGGQRTLVFYRANKRARGAQNASFRLKIGPERESGDNFTPETRTGAGGGGGGARKVATRRPSGKEALFSRTRSFASPARTHDTNTNRNRFPGPGGKPIGNLLTPQTSDLCDFLKKLNMFFANF